MQIIKKPGFISDIFYHCTCKMQRGLIILNLVTLLQYSIVCLRQSTNIFFHVFSLSMISPINTYINWSRHLQVSIFCYTRVKAFSRNLKSLLCYEQKHYRVKKNMNMVVCQCYLQRIWTVQLMCEHLYIHYINHHYKNYHIRQCCSFLDRLCISSSRPPGFRQLL